MQKCKGLFPADELNPKNRINQFYNLPVMVSEQGRGGTGTCLLEDEFRTPMLRLLTNGASQFSIIIQICQRRSWYAGGHKYNFYRAVAVSSSTFAAIQWFQHHPCVQIRILAIPGANLISTVVGCMRKAEGCSVTETQLKQHIFCWNGGGLVQWPRCTLSCGWVTGDVSFHRN